MKLKRFLAIIALSVRLTNFGKSTSTTDLIIDIDNLDCDPSTWNNHGSIVEFQGQCFYHRQTQNSQYNRRVCAEPIEFNEDGSICRVEMTTRGINVPILFFCIP